MKKLLVLVFILCGCTPTSKTTEYQINPNVINNSSIGNSYEIIKIGPYTCVGMDGFEAGGLWCERTGDKNENSTNK